MNSRRFFTLWLCLFMPLAWADDHRDAALALIHLSDTPEQMQDLADFLGHQAAASVTVAISRDEGAEERGELDKTPEFQQRVRDAAQQIYGWEGLEADMVTVYTDTYSYDELIVLNSMIRGRETPQATQQFLRRMEVKSFTEVLNRVALMSKRDREFTRTVKEIRDDYLTY